MKKHVVSALLLFFLCVTLFFFPAYAEDTASDFSTPPEISKLQILPEDGSCYLEFTIRTPANVRNIMSLLKLGDNSHYISGIEVSFSLEGGSWQQAPMTFDGSGDRWSGPWRSAALGGLTARTWVQVKARYTGTDDDGEPVLSNWSGVLSLNASEEQTEPVPLPQPTADPVEFDAHEWAKGELLEADALGLIPAAIRRRDLKEPITRAEFAAVSVKVYEALSGLRAEPVTMNPFVDTADSDVLKAYGAGITNGVSLTEFAPNQLLNREQAATMLTRVYKKVALSGWTLDNDGSLTSDFKAMFTMPEPFADDASISSWARDSVYFMSAKGIINGVGNNTFAPRAVTQEEQAAGYAQATREQAILIAVRMVKNLS